jgi:hypothetical protein
MGNLPNVVPASLQSSQSIPHQISIPFDAVELQRMTTAQRTRAIRYLASLLMQAAGIATVKERDDDER